MDCPVVVDALIEGFRVRRIHVDGGEVSYPLGVIDLEVTMGECGKTRTVIMEFAVVKSPSPYNALLGRTGMRSLGAVASTIHSMIKFPNSNGISTIATTRETLKECRQIEEAQALSRHARVTDPTPMQISSEVANPRVSLAPVETRSRRLGKEPMQLDDMEERRKLDKGKKPPKSSKRGKDSGYNDIKPGATRYYRRACPERKYWSCIIHTAPNGMFDIFAWTPTDMTGIPRVITEHSLDTYPYIEPKVQKKSSLDPDRRKVVTDEVNEWLKADIVRRVRYPTWVANPVLVKKVNGRWRMCIDFKDLNKACPKDLYPLLEIDWKIESLTGFQYKCFLDAYKGYHQIQMTQKDEEKTAFHTEEGVFYYMKMPFGLKNTEATYQRLVDSAFKEQIRVNLEAYMDDMVIKSRTEQANIKDIKQTFSTLRRINMKLNPKKCSFDTLKKCTSKKDFRWTEAAEAAFLEMKKLVFEFPTLTTPKKGEILMMYLAAANEAVSTVLLTERDGKKMPIHYVSRSLQGAETNYAPMEKLALALVHAARRLRRYFQAHPIKVITDSPIGQVLNNSGASGRLAKWAVELGAYGITYVPRVAVKGQVLADFLADTPTEINATPEVANNPRVEDIPESSNAREDLTPGPRAWRLYTDGASNNEGSEDGLILIAPDDVEYSYALRLNFSNSNNDAEYEALLAGLRIAKEMRVKDIHAFVDSKLVASQVEGSYEAKSERMIKYRENVLELAGAFNRFRITHIPRAENRKVDALSKLAAVQFDHLSKEVLVEVLNERSVEAQEVNMVVEEEGPSWITPIRNYIEKRKLPEDLVDARTLMEKIRNYTMEDGVLYRKSYLVLLMRPRQVVAKAMNLGYYWPSMHRDANNETQFVNDPFKKWTEKLKIQLISTSVYHPQGNGAVERANKSLLRGIKTRLEKGGSAWAKEVPNVLWAHRTMKKTSNGETPFSLTYWYDVVIPERSACQHTRTSSVE
ncbi:reverse transcriptase domain-containing protein [Tanacetum coccineum]